MNIEDDVSGLLLAEDTLMRIFSEAYDKKIIRIETEGRDLKLVFDPREKINAVILGLEDVEKVLADRYGKKILTVEAEPHEHYLIRFRE